jgi:FkbM family methyltransferase
MEKFRKIVRKAFLSLGIDIRRVKPNQLTWLKNQDIKTVFDIGANTGQFATEIHSILPEATTYSFEPLKDCYEQLCRNMRKLSRFRAFNLALGDRDCEMEIHRSKFSPSSSLLPVTELSERLFPYTRVESIEKIKVMRLDEVARGLCCAENILVKIDVQGYEDKVILGGKETISKAKVLLVETSFSALYEGQPLFDEMYDVLRNMGFSYAGNLEQIKSPADSRVIQSDSIFLNRRFA